MTVYPKRLLKAPLDRAQESTQFGMPILGPVMIGDTPAVLPHAMYLLEVPAVHLHLQGSDSFTKSTQRPKGPADSTSSWVSSV